MAPDFADIASLLLGLTQRGIQFQWVELGRHTLRRLTQLVIDWAIVQATDTTKPTHSAPVHRTIYGLIKLCSKGRTQASTQTNGLLQPDYEPS